MGTALSAAVPPPPPPTVRQCLLPTDVRQAERISFLPADVCAMLTRYVLPAWSVHVVGGFGKRFRMFDDPAVIHPPAHYDPAVTYPPAHYVLTSLENDADEPRDWLAGASPQTAHFLYSATVVSLDAECMVLLGGYYRDHMAFAHTVQATPDTDVGAVFACRPLEAIGGKPPHASGTFLVLPRVSRVGAAVIRYHDRVFAMGGHCKRDDSLGQPAGGGAVHSVDVAARVGTNELPWRTHACYDHVHTFHASVAHDELVFSSGGYCVDDFSAYDPHADRHVAFAAATMLQPRHEHAALSVAGAVWTVGGRANVLVPGTRHCSLPLEFFDPRDAAGRVRAVGESANSTSAAVRVPYTDTIMCVRADSAAVVLDLRACQETPPLTEWVLHSRLPDARGSNLSMCVSREP